MTNDSLSSRIKELKTTVAQGVVVAEIRRRSWRVLQLQGLVDEMLALRAAPPSGGGVVTATGKLPAVARSEALSVIVNWVGPTNVEACIAPLNVTDDEGIKPRHHHALRDRRLQLFYALRFCGLSRCRPELHTPPGILRDRPPLRW